MDTDAWTNFFAAQVGAAAPLLGLLFVGLSMNLSKILSFTSLADRAAIGMGLLFAIIFIGSLVMIPGQPLSLLGAEILVIGLVLLISGTRLELRALRAAPHQLVPLGNAIIFWLAAGAFVVGGGLLASGATAGFYVVATAVLLSLMKAVLDAWVLLVEINR